MGALKTRRLRMKPPTPASIERLIGSDPDLAGTTLSPAARRWLNALELIGPSTGGDAWLICRRAAPQMIGLFAYQRRWDEEGVEISYMILRRWRGRGFGLEATQAACGFLINQLHATRLVADVEIGNEASERILSRLGFSPKSEPGVTVGLQASEARRWVYVAPGTFRFHADEGLATA